MLQSVIFIFIVTGAVVNINAMTREQLKKTMTVMKNQCMPKHGVTNVQVGKIEQGVFMPEHKVMCYVACIYRASQVVKNDRLHKESIMKQIDILYPQDLRASAKKNAAICSEVQDKYSDSCEGIFYATKCLYEADPQSFIFP